jgi:hypothetical protein
MVMVRCGRPHMPLVARAIVPMCGSPLLRIWLLIAFGVEDVTRPVSQILNTQLIVERTRSVWMC